MSISSLLSTLILNASARALVGLSRPVSIITIVLQRVIPDGGHVFLFQNDEDDLAKLHPLLLATDDVTEHAAKQIREVLERRDIDFDHLYLVPEEMSLRPIMNLTLHLAIATVSQEEFIRAKVNNFRSIPVGQVHMHRETNVFFEFVARSHDARALLN